MLRKQTLFLLSLLILGFSSPVFSQKIISVSDYGIKPNTFEDATSMVRQAIKACESEMEVQFSKPVPSDMVVGDCLENTTWTPSVTIRDCRFERTNTRGLLITTRRKVLIENNTFYRSGMHAILISSEASSWYESGPVQDVTIRNNSFEEGGYNQAPGNYVIAIAPENHELVPGYMVHRNIRIENNIFKVYDYPILTARSTENLFFTGNKIIMTDFMAKGKKRPEFDLTSCSKVMIDNNIFLTPQLPEIKATHMVKGDVKSDMNTIFTK